MELCIRTTASVVSQKLKLETTASRKRLFTRASRKLRKKNVRNFLLAGNLFVLLVVFAFLIHNSGNVQANNLAAVAGVTPAATVNNSSTQANPLDQLSSSQIAVQVARMTGLYEATSVSNLADSENAATNIVPSDNQVINKPTVIATAAKSKEDISQYVTKAGDTVSALAVKFGVTSNSIMWSNSLSSDALTPGLTLNIPPVNGIVYAVKSGDTVTSLAQKYNVDATQITAFNDAEISGIKPNEQIVIPNATAPKVSLASSSSSKSSGGSYGGSNYSFGYGPVYGSNGYDFGYCTWWVAQRRAALGISVPSNLGNASTWYSLSQSAGIPTGSIPQAHAVLWFGYYSNHVGFVESVNQDGSFVISEMNRNGWDVEDTRTISSEEAANYKFIY